LNLNRNSCIVKKTSADRPAIANRWDFPLAQWGKIYSFLTTWDFQTKLPFGNMKK
jgi:hypothetical protein